MNTVKKSLRKESKMASSKKHPSSPISEHSQVKGTPQAIREWLMSLPQDFPVSRLVSPESKKEQQTKEICGPQQQKLFRLSDHDTFCLKTCPEYASTCPWSSETCGDLVTPFADPSSLGLTTLAESTDENESGSCRNWPTARACDGIVRHSRRWMQKRIDEKKDVDLTTAVKMWPTPTLQDAKNNGAPSQMERNTKPLNAEVGGSLNPTWVEGLMGWPKDWTCLNPISHVEYLQWLMGGTNDKETRTREAMRILRIGNAAEEVSRSIGRPVGIQEAAILLSELCEHANRPDEARLFMACAETLEKEMRGVRVQQGIAGTPSGSEHQKQREGEHSDVMQALSRLLAYYGQKAWKDGSWENGIPRVANKVASRVDRLKAIGNGQVPIVAATAWEILSEGVMNG